MSQTQTRLDPSHPDPAERATLLRVQLGRLQEQLEFFHTGVRLTHFGAYADAEYFLREFQTVFPGREVHNNLGYGYLQRARRELPPNLAYRYCLPTLLDTTTRAAAIVQRGGGEETAAITAEARTLLLQAVDALNRAVAADSAYLPARLNLAAAYFYLNEIYQARAVIEAARKLAPDDREVQNLRALILYREGVDADTWPSALKLLEDLAAQPQASACLTYNLAQLLEERQRSAKARTVWTALARRLPELPLPYRQTVCEHAATEAACRTLTTAPIKVAAPPWPLPAPLGLDLLQEPNRAKRYLAGWTPTAFDWQQPGLTASDSGTIVMEMGTATAFDWQQPGLKGHLYRSPPGASVLELDGYVELVVLWGEGLGTEDTLRTCCGQPTLQQPVVGGTLWSYGNQWAALVREGQVAEVWVKRQPVRL